MSTRSSDVRVAQQLSALATIPMILVTSLLSFQVVKPSLALAVLVASILGVIDLAGWRIVSAMFDRERLLTRYGRR
jgi:ABC-2 type transport system permease protein